MTYCRGGPRQREQKGGGRHHRPRSRGHKYVVKAYRATRLGERGRWVRRSREMHAGRQAPCAGRRCDESLVERCGAEWQRVSEWEWATLADLSPQPTSARSRPSDRRRWAARFDRSRVASATAARRGLTTTSLCNSLSRRVHCVALATTALLRPPLLLHCCSAAVSTSAAPCSSSLSAG